MTTSNFTFKVNSTYIMTFITDRNLKVQWTVVKRTAKTITLISEHDRKVTKKIQLSSWKKDGRLIEFVQPLGRYSMSPSLLACSIKEQEAPKKPALNENAESWLWLCEQ